MVDLTDLNTVMELQEFPQGSPNPLSRGKVRQACYNYQGNGSLSDFMEHLREELGVSGDPLVVQLARQMLERRKELGSWD